MSRQKPTIDDVASLAGVGRTTVSRVLNNGPNVRAEIRERVRRAVQMLDYTVNLQARNLAGGSSRQLKLVHASDLDHGPHSFYDAGLELGALRACAAHGFSLVTHTVNQEGPAPDQQILAIVTAQRCDGVILAPPFSDHVVLVETLRANACPVVCISAGPEVWPIAASIGIDDAAASAAITEYLVGLGHRRFGFVGGPGGHRCAESRFGGFLRALGVAGIDVATVRVERGNFTFRSGIEAAQRILQSSAERPTALVCANDNMAAGALLAIHKAGLEIPRDISVTGFDDAPVSQVVWPRLTTVQQPTRALGQRAVELLADAVSGDRDAAVPGREVLECRIVKRDSCAAPC